MAVVWCFSLNEQRGVASSGRSSGAMFRDYFGGEFAIRRLPHLERKALCGNENDLLGLDRSLRIGFRGSP